MNTETMKGNQWSDQSTIITTAHSVVLWPSGVDPAVILWSSRFDLEPLYGAKKVVIRTMTRGRVRPVLSLRIRAKYLWLSQQKKSIFCQNFGFLRSNLSKIFIIWFFRSNFPVFLGEKIVKILVFQNRNLSKFWFLKLKCGQMVKIGQNFGFSGQIFSVKKKNCPIYDLIKRKGEILLDDAGDCRYLARNEPVESPSTGHLFADSNWLLIGCVICWFRFRKRTSWVVVALTWQSF